MHHFERRVEQQSPTVISRRGFLVKSAETCCWSLAVAVTSARCLTGTALLCLPQAFINTAKEIYEKIQEGVFDINNEVRRPLRVLHALPPRLHLSPPHVPTSSQSFSGENKQAASELPLRAASQPDGYLLRGIVTQAQSQETEPVSKYALVSECSSSV